MMVRGGFSCFDHCVFPGQAGISVVHGLVCEVVLVI